MRRLGIVLLLTVLTAIGPAAADDGRPPYPTTRVEDVVENLHGTEVRDPYRWLEDGAAAEVQQWAKDQNTFARRQLDGLPGRDRLTKRLQEVSYVDAVGVPRRAGSRLFFTRRKTDQEKAVLYWPGDIDGVDHGLVEPNALENDGSERKSVG
jgi:prolyl oligopeptidase